MANKSLPIAAMVLTVLLFLSAASEGLDECRENSDCGDPSEVCAVNSGPIFRGDRYCCRPIGAACAVSFDCCRNNRTRFAVSDHECRGGRCCAPYGTVCRKDEDCCSPSFGRPRRCYPDHRGLKFCR